MNRQTDRILVTLYLMITKSIFRILQSLALLIHKVQMIFLYALTEVARIL